MAVPEKHAFALPEEIPRGWGPLIELVSCAIHGFDRLSPRIGEHVLVYGAGTIGLILCRLAVHRAAGSVAVVDHNPARLAGATAAGADQVALSAGSSTVRRGGRALGQEPPEDLVDRHRGAGVMKPSLLSPVVSSRQTFALEPARPPATRPRTPHEHEHEHERSAVLPADRPATPAERG